jgi:hypothetical protein
MITAVRLVKTLSFVLKTNVLDYFVCNYMH